MDPHTRGKDKHPSAQVQLPSYSNHLTYSRTSGVCTIAALKVVITLIEANGGK